MSVLRFFWIIVPTEVNMVGLLFFNHQNHLEVSVKNFPRPKYSDSGPCHPLHPF